MVCMKESIAEYSKAIDSVTCEIRKEISEGVSCTGTALHKYVEERLFTSEFIEFISTDELNYVIESIFNRVKSKYGILSSILEDDSVNEIMVNGPNKIFIEKERELIEIDDAFTSEEELESIMRMFASDVHREINEANPIVDARLPSGYRVNGVLKNVALNGPILTIRKFSENPITMEQLVEYGSVTKECKEDLETLVRCGYNIFISGGTSSGKTTFLNALSSAISKNERVIVIEDSSELKLSHINNIVHMECRNANSIGKGSVNMEKLIKTSLRMRPDRIIVGEVRGSEVIDMIQAMSTGHDGSMSTGHGNSIRGMLNRLETMYMSGSSIPISSIRNQIANAIDVFVHLRRDSNGKRAVVEVAEMQGFNGDEYSISYLYGINANGNLSRTGNALSDRMRLKRGNCDDRLQ